MDQTPVFSALSGDADRCVLPLKSRAKSVGGGSELISNSRVNVRDHNASGQERPLSPALWADPPSSENHLRAPDRLLHPLAGSPVGPIQLACCSRVGGTLSLRPQKRTVKTTSGAKAEVGLTPWRCSWQGLASTPSLLRRLHPSPADAGTRRRASDSVPRSPWCPARSSPDLGTSIE
jgi:hypothetical protein